MEIDDAILVDHVRRTPIIYDKEHGGFKFKHLKDNAWCSIGATLNIHPHIAQTRWKVLREKYSVERRKEKINPTDFAAKKPWALYSNMSFLEKHVTMRKRVVGTNSSPNSSFQPSSSMSPWNGVSKIEIEETEMIDEYTESSSHSFDHSAEIPEQSEKDNYTVTEQKMQTPSSKRLMTDDTEVINKVSSAFDAFSTSLESKYYRTDFDQNMEHESTINLLKSFGYDLLRIKNRKIRFDTEIAMMKIVKQALYDDMME